MSKLTSLAPELVHIILEYLPVTALLSLRATCKLFCHLVTHRVFSVLVLDLVKSNAPRQLELLRSIPNPLCTITSSITTLHIDSLYTTDHGSEDGDSSDWDEDAVQAVLSQHLAPSISKLCKLETVRWTHHLDDDPSSHLLSVANGLSSLPSLKNLEITIEGDFFNDQTHLLPPLRDFKHLSTLSLSFCDDIPAKYCDQEIASAIAASPKLASLSIRNLDGPVHGRVVKTCTSFQCFLKTARPELLQLELKRVPLPNEGLRQTLSSNLQQLSVSGPPGSRGFDFDWVELWSTLQETLIKLSALKVSGSERAMDEMFTYLLSYAGLQKLEILAIQMDLQEQEESIAQRLWLEIVPQHQDSLTRLAIEPYYESGLCYSPLAAVALGGCRLLRNLTLSVCSVDSSWAEAKFSQAREMDKVDFCDLATPLGEPENCAALIVCDLKAPMTELKLFPTRVAADRIKDIHHLDHRTRQKSSPQTYQALQRKRYIRTRLEAVLLGLHAPGTASRNWPLVVQANYSSLVKGPVLSGVGMWGYNTEEED